jgi:hypothetical protein
VYKREAISRKLFLHRRKTMSLKRFLLVWRKRVLYYFSRIAGRIPVKGNRKSKN